MQQSRMNNLPAQNMSNKGRTVPMFSPGSTRIGVADVITALILLAILVWASWMQFPAYNKTGAAGQNSSTTRSAVPVQNR
jgi:hypothetical protein